MSSLVWKWPYVRPEMHITFYLLILVYYCFGIKRCMSWKICCCAASYGSWNLFFFPSYIILYYIFCSSTGHLSIVDTRTTGGLYSSLKSVFKDKDIKHTDYNGNEINEKYPGLHYDKSFKGYYEPSGKVIMANLALQTLWVSMTS